MIVRYPTATYLCPPALSASSSFVVVVTSASFLVYSCKFVASLNVPHEKSFARGTQHCSQAYAASSSLTVALTSRPIKISKARSSEVAFKGLAVPSSSL